MDKYKEWEEILEVTYKLSVKHLEQNSVSVRYNY